MKPPRGLPYISVVHACKNNGTLTNRTSVTIAISNLTPGPSPSERWRGEQLIRRADLQDSARDGHGLIGFNRSRLDRGCKIRGHDIGEKADPGLLFAARVNGAATMEEISWA